MVSKRVFGYVEDSSQPLVVPVLYAESIAASIVSMAD